MKTNKIYIRPLLVLAAISSLSLNAQAEQVFEFPEEYLEVIPSGDKATGNLGSSVTQFIEENIPPSNSPWGQYADNPSTPDIDESTANNEADVSYALIDHYHPNVSRRFELRIGAGGQIFSLKNPRFGEAIPPQFAGGRSWIDEVFQFNQVPLDDISSSSGHPTLHQAGMYLNSYMYDQDGVAAPFYSPALVSGRVDDSFVTLNWVQLAHQNGSGTNSNTATSLVYSKYRVFHPGVIEVTNYAYNFGDRNYNFISAPWGGVRRTSLPDIMIGDLTSGSSVKGTFLQPDANNSIVSWLQNRQNIDETGGWVLFSDGQTSYSPAVGLVFGNEDKAEYHGVSDFMRVGYFGHHKYKQYPTTDEAAWRNYNPFQVLRRPRVTGGECILSRYYIVVGSPFLVQTIIKNLGLVEKAKFEVLTPPQVSSTDKLYTWRRTSKGAMPVLNGKGSLVAHVRARPIPGFKPVFVLKDISGGPNDGDIYCSYDPYRLCTTIDPDGTVRRTPYDLTTEFVGLLGYANTSAFPSLD